MDKLLIEGIEILYSKYHVNAGTQILWWVFLVLTVGITIAAIVMMIIDRNATDWWVVLLWVVFCGTILLIGWSHSFPYTEYHVKIDDTVPYNYVTENFENITHEGEDCYEIIIYDYGD